MKSDTPSHYYDVSWYGAHARSMFGQEADLCGIEPRWVDGGKPITNWNPGISFLVRGKHAQDFLHNVVSWPIVSDRLKGLIEEAGLTGVTFHPIQTSHVSGKDIGRYWYMNVLGIDGALNLDRSTYFMGDAGGLLSEPVLTMLVKPVLLRSGIGGRDAFRVSEFSPPVFVSSRFRDVYECNGCSGAVFREVLVT